MVPLFTYEPNMVRYSAQPLKVKWLVFVGIKCRCSGQLIPDSSKVRRWGHEEVGEEVGSGLEL